MLLEQVFDVRLQDVTDQLSVVTVIPLDQLVDFPAQLLKGARGILIVCLFGNKWGKGKLIVGRFRTAPSIGFFLF